VPVDQLLPTNGAAPQLRGPSSGRVTIDLSRLTQVEGPERESLQHYITMIQLQRGDFNGRMITIRSDDVSALGRVFERSEGAMRERLLELGICV
jgi:hypothetical protein